MLNLWTEFQNVFGCLGFCINLVLWMKTKCTNAQKIFNTRDLNWFFLQMIISQFQIVLLSQRINTPGASQQFSIKRKGEKISLLVVPLLRFTTSSSFIRKGDDYLYCIACVKFEAFQKAQNFKLVWEWANLFLKNVLLGMKKMRSISKSWNVTMIW